MSRNEVYLFNLLKEKSYQIYMVLRLKLKNKNYIKKLNVKIFNRESNQLALNVKWKL